MGHRTAALLDSCLLPMVESDDGILPDDFLMQVNGNTVTYLGSSYDTQLLDGIGFEFFDYFNGIVENIFQLENDSFVDEGFLTFGVFGIAIDLDDFGVAPLATVDTVHFGTPLNFPSFDPMLFMGINSAGMPGDFDNSGAVGQIDLNLVLQNWGETSPPVPAGWINEQPTGLIGQTHLNKVLQNWGNSVVAGASAVPEPTTCTLALAALCLAMSRRRV